MNESFDRALRDQLVEASERLHRERRRRRWWQRRRAVGGAVVIVFAGAAGASAGLGWLSESRTAASADFAEALRALPRVELVSLPPESRGVLEGLAAARRSTVKDRGWTVGRQVSAFALASGELCLLGPQGASCSATDDVAPAISFGYQPRTGRTSLAVIVPPSLEDLEAETADDRRVALQVRSGVVDTEIAGVVTHLHWRRDGRAAVQELAVDLSTTADDDRP